MAGLPGSARRPGNNRRGRDGSDRPSSRAVPVGDGAVLRAWKARCGRRGAIVGGVRCARAPGAVVMNAVVRELEGKRALIVEDNFLVGLLLEEQVASLGIKVVGMVPSEEEALGTIGSGPIDVALLDINILGGSSEGVARRLQELAVPFIFVSGYASPNVLSPDLRAHARLTKPVNERELSDTLVRALADRGRSGGTLPG